MTSYRPVDSKREEFRKYLEKAGAMDAMTKVLVMLYDEPEKPADALDYIRKHLGDNNRPDDAELEVLKSDLEEARLKIQTLEDEIAVLKERLTKYEPLEEHTPMEEGEAETRGSTKAQSKLESEGGTVPIDEIKGAESAANASGGNTSPVANQSAANASGANASVANASAAGSQPQ